jgi:hypothetical protein
MPLWFWKSFFLCFVSLHVQFATEAAITILRIDDMIKLYKDDDGGEEWGVSEAASGVSSQGF